MVAEFRDGGELTWVVTEYLEPAGGPADDAGLLFRLYCQAGLVG